MDVKPLKRYTGPGYPTRDILDAHPELLRLLPRRWRQQALVLAAVAAVGTLTAGCRTQAASAQDPPERVTVPAAATHVAPIFPHGDGHGFFGGKPAPTYFLTEEEARLVVVEEGKRAGINFTADGQTLKDVPLPVMRTAPDAAGKEETRRDSLTLDGADVKRQIAYEYVSDVDFAAWKKQGEMNPSTASEMNVQAAAKALRDGLEQTKPAGAYGVFYDPIVTSLPEQTQGKPATFDERTLAPMSIFCWDGWKAQFDETTGAVTLTGKRTIVMKVGSAQATVDGNTVAMPSAVRVRYGTPYLPLKWIADALGGSASAHAEHQVKLQAPSGGPYWGKVETVTLDGLKDPVTVAFGWNDDATRRGMALETAREQLRLQVRDFIKWLKAEGVI